MREFAGGREAGIEQRGPGAAHRRGGGALDVGDEALAERALVIHVLRLAEHGEGAAEKSLDRLLRAGRRVRADHDDGHGLALHDELEEGEAGHARHVEVERHDVDLEAGEAVARVVGVGGAADELDLLVLAENVGEHLAEDGGVVHGENTDAAAWAHHAIFRKMLGLICFRPRGFCGSDSAWPMMR